MRKAAVMLLLLNSILLAQGVSAGSIKGVVTDERSSTTSSQRLLGQEAGTVLVHYQIARPASCQNAVTRIGRLRT